MLELGKIRKKNLKNSQLTILALPDGPLAQIFNFCEIEFVRKILARVCYDFFRISKHDYTDAHNAPHYVKLTRKIVSRAYSQFEIYTGDYSTFFSENFNPQEKSFQVPVQDEFYKNFAVATRQNEFYCPKLKYLLFWNVNPKRIRTLLLYNTENCTLLLSHLPSSHDNLCQFSKNYLWEASSTIGHTLLERVEINNPNSKHSMYTIKSEISKIFVVDELRNMLYYISGHSIYKHNLSSSKTDLVFNHKSLPYAMVNLKFNPAYQTLFLTFYTFQENNNYGMVCIINTKNKNAKEKAIVVKSEKKYPDARRPNHPHLLIDEKTNKCLVIFGRRDAILYDGNNGNIIRKFPHPKPIRDVRWIKQEQQNSELFLFFGRDKITGYKASPPPTVELTRNANETKDGAGSESQSSNTEEITSYKPTSRRTIGTNSKSNKTKDEASQQVVYAQASFHQPEVLEEELIEESSSKKTICCLPRLECTIF